MTIEAIELEDIPKYKKKTRSNVSKSYHKSKHKHEYHEVLFNCDNDFVVAKVCKTCGKVDNVIRPTKKVELNGCIVYTELTNEEILKTYKKLEIIKVDDLWTKYIPVSVMVEV